MPIVTLALYGSCARRDDDEQSDVDILAVTTEDKIFSHVDSKLTFSYYPKQYLLDRARAGDLFVLHLVREARALYDHSGVMDELRDSFALKASYSDEIRSASDLGWFLVRWAEKFENYLLLNKRIAWCVRTILIAKSTEQGGAVFSAMELSKFSEFDITYDLIRNKNCDRLLGWVIPSFKDFLEKFGANDYKQLLQSSSYEESLAHFEIHANDVGKSTAELLLRKLPFSTSYL